MKRLINANTASLWNPMAVLGLLCFLTSVLACTATTQGQANSNPNSNWASTSTCEGCNSGCAGCLSNAMFSGHAQPCSSCDSATTSGWHWNASPSEQHRAVASLYNRYCIRCHGVDGRGVCDIPDVPNFTNPMWQASRTDEQLARLTYEGRGAVMPAFRGTLSMDESWAMARYIRHFANQGVAPNQTMQSIQPNVQYPVPNEQATETVDPTSMRYQITPHESIVNTWRSPVSPKVPDAPDFKSPDSPQSTFDVPPIGVPRVSNESAPTPNFTGTPPAASETFDLPVPSKSPLTISDPIPGFPLIESPVQSEPTPMQLPLNEFIRPLDSGKVPSALEPSSASNFEPPTASNFEPFKLVAPDAGIEAHRQLSHGSLLPAMEPTPASHPGYPSTEPSKFRIFSNSYPTTKK